MLNRLKLCRKTLKLNQRDFGKQLGLTQTGYSMIENGTNPLSDRYIQLICSVFHVNEAWLRTGEGDMFSASPYQKRLNDIFERLVPVNQRYLFLMAEELLNTQEKLLQIEEK